MSLCTVSFTAFYLFIYYLFIYFPLDNKPPTLVSLQRTLQRHWEWWAAKPRNEKAGQCRRTHREAGDTTPSGCPWVTFTILKLCSSGEGRRVQDLQERGPQSEDRLPGQRGGGRKVDLRFSIDSSIFNSFLTKGKEKKKWIKKKQKPKTKKQHLN